MEPLNPVVVGVDDSPESSRAARLGCAIAKAAGAECRLIHVVRNYPLESSILALLPLQPALITEMGRRVENALRRSVPDDMLREVTVLTGPTAMVLIEAARDASLLVLGGKRHALPERWLAGSTAHQAVRSSHTPVLIAGASIQSPRRILAAVDLSEGARSTLLAAEYMARLADAELRVLHVVELLPPPMSAAGLTVSPPIVMDTDSWYRSAEEAFHRDIWPLVEYPGAHPLVSRGSTEAEIRRAAAEWNADLVVVGTHGRGLINRLLVGSTAHHLLNDLPASLLVVPVSAAVPALANAAH